MKTLALHIGIHKTGTTAIQNFAVRNRDRLAAHGILFPRTGFLVRPRRTTEDATPGHLPLARSLARPTSKEAGRVRTELFREMEAEDCPTLLITSETMSAPGYLAPGAGLAPFLARGYRPRVIAYLRRQDTWLDSWYRERVRWVGKMREKRSLDAFVAEEGDEWLDYGARLAVWEDAVGSENVELRSYEDVRQARGIVPDFFDQLGVDVSKGEFEVSRSRTYHPSLPGSLVELVRAFNSLEDFERLDKIPLTKALMTLAPQSEPGESILPDSMWEKIARRYGPKNESLCRERVSRPCDALRFPQRREPTRIAKQRFSYDESLVILKGLREALNAGKSGESRSLLSHLLARIT